MPAGHAATIRAARKESYLVGVEPSVSADAQPLPQLKVQR